MCVCVYFFNLLYGCAGQSFQFLQDLVAALGELFCNISLLCLPPRGLEHFNKNHQLRPALCSLDQRKTPHSELSKDSRNIPKLGCHLRCLPFQGNSINTTWGYHPFFQATISIPEFQPKKKRYPQLLHRREPIHLGFVSFSSPGFVFANLWWFFGVYFSITKVHPKKWVVGQLVFLRQIADINGRRFENGCATRCKYVVI